MDKPPPRNTVSTTQHRTTLSINWGTNPGGALRRSPFQGLSGASGKHRLQHGVNRGYMVPSLHGLAKGVPDLPVMSASNPVVVSSECAATSPFQSADNGGFWNYTFIR
jgi:hypothetical protein